MIRQHYGCRGNERRVANREVQLVFVQPANELTESYQRLMQCVGIFGTTELLREFSDLCRYKIVNLPQKCNEPMRRVCRIVKRLELLESNLTRLIRTKYAICEGIRQGANFAHVRGAVGRDK